MLFCEGRCRWLFLDYLHIEESRALASPGNGSPRGSAMGDYGGGVCSAPGVCWIQSNTARRPVPSCLVSVTILIILCT